MPTPRGVGADRVAHVASHVGSCQPDPGCHRQEHRSGQGPPRQRKRPPEARQQSPGEGQQIGVLSGDDVAPAGLRQESGGNMRLGHLADIDGADSQAWRTEASSSVDEHPRGREALTGGCAPQGGTNDHGRVDGHQVPSPLLGGQPPRLLLREGLGVGIGLVAGGGGGVPAGLGQDSPRVALDVDGVAVHGHDRAGEDHPRDRRRALDSGQHVTGSLQGRLDQVVLWVVRRVQNGRGGVNDDRAALQRLVVGAGLEQIAGEETQSTRCLLGHAVQVGHLVRVLGVAHGGTDGDAGVEQALGDPAAQVAGGAGDHDGAAGVDRDAAQVDGGIEVVDGARFRGSHGRSLTALGNEVNQFHY